jgi:hypothetical protein
LEKNHAVAAKRDDTLAREIRLLLLVEVGRYERALDFTRSNFIFRGACSTGSNQDDCCPSQFIPRSRHSVLATRVTPHEPAVNPPTHRDGFQRKPGRDGELP